MIMITLLIPVVAKIAGDFAGDFGASLGASIGKPLGEALPSLAERVLSNHSLGYNVEQGIHGLKDTIQAGFAHQEAMLASIQSSINAIGMLSAVGCALSAVNVFQLVKVQRSLNRIEKKLDNGFVDLKFYFNDKIQELLDQQQKRNLSQAYNLYLNGIEQIQTALLIEDGLQRNLYINNAINNFIQALTIYDDREESNNSNAPASLRRLECCWAITSAIAEAHHIKGEYAAALNFYDKLRNQIREQTDVIKQRMNPDNYRLIISDLHWIHRNDLRVIDTKVNLLKKLASKEHIVPTRLKLSVKQHDQDENVFDGIYLPAAKLYLDCLISLDQQDIVRKKVIEQRSDLRFKRLPLIKFCGIYSDIFNLIDDAEYENSYLSPQESSRKFISLMENLFLKHNNIGYRINHNNLAVKDLYKISDPNHQIYEEVQYFNYAVYQYLSAANQYFLKTRKVNRREKLELHDIATKLGFSTSFADCLNKMLIDDYESKREEYSRQHKQKLIALYIQEGGIHLNATIELELQNFEKNIPLTDKEVLKNRNELQSNFLNIKEEVILKTKFDNLNQENEILIWKIQDSLLINQQQAIAFIEGCRRSVQQYKELLTKLRGNNNDKLSVADKEILSQFQKLNGLSHKVISKM